MIRRHRGPGGIQLVTHPKSWIGGSGSTPNIIRATDHWADMGRQTASQNRRWGCRDTSLSFPICVQSMLHSPSSAQAALAFVQIRSCKPCFSPRGTVCTSGFARKLVPPMLSPKETAKKWCMRMQDSFINTMAYPATPPVSFSSSSLVIV